MAQKQERGRWRGREGRRDRLGAGWTERWREGEIERGRDMGRDGGRDGGRERDSACEPGGKDEVTCLSYDIVSQEGFHGVKILLIHLQRT